MHLTKHRQPNQLESSQPPEIKTDYQKDDH